MKVFLGLIIALSFIASALAGPGAHGPNGEHLDGQANVAAGGAVPRVETFSEMFELVGQLSGSELSVMIDRYETNEPVLNGVLEVEYKGLKAVAKYHADMGDYAINDPRMLKALSAPGKHALIFTLVAGEESDLLEGTLEVHAASAATHTHTAYWKWVAGALAAVAAVILALFIRRRRGKTTP